MSWPFEVKLSIRLIFVDSFVMCVIYFSNAIVYTSEAMEVASCQSSEKNMHSNVSVSSLLPPVDVHSICVDKSAIGTAQILTSVRNQEQMDCDEVRMIKLCISSDNPSLIFS